MRYSAALELDELERDIGPTSVTNDVIAQLGKEWSQRRNGNPPVDAITDWLRRDHADTLTGAKHRRGTRSLPPDVISRAWLVSRREQMRFQADHAERHSPIPHKGSRGCACSGVAAQSHPQRRQCEHRRAPFCDHDSSAESKRAAGRLSGRGTWRFAVRPTHANTH